MPHAPKILNEFHSLMQIVKDLRGPDGCPWDKEQTHQSLSPFAVEEVYELVDAIESNNDTALKEELGDVLFQVALHCQLAEERQAFGPKDVLQVLGEKLIRRHPHVFSTTKVKDIAEVWTNWEKIKHSEKAANSQEKQKIFDFPNHLPGLQRAYKIGLKSQKLKFDWNKPEDVFLKVIEELTELQQELININDPEITDKKIVLGRINEEFGDLLFSLAQWARHLNIEPEQSLRMANLKFEKRFDKMMTLVSQKQLQWEQLSDSEKENLWQEIKD